MKKYQLGALTVSDKGLQDTKEEIVIELIDRMQKYVAEGKAAYENRDYTEEQKLNVLFMGKTGSGQRLIIATLTAHTSGGRMRI